MDKLLKRILEWMKKTYGEAIMTDGGICRALVPGLGTSHSAAMLEISVIGKNELAEGHKADVIQIFSTLATDIEDKVAEVLPSKLADVNRSTLLGCYYYMPSHRYIVHSYRMQVDSMRTGAAFDSVMWAVGQIIHQNDMFIDYILITAEDPEELAFDDFRVGTQITTF